MEGDLLNEKSSTNDESSDSYKVGGSPKRPSYRRTSVSEKDKGKASSFPIYNLNFSNSLFNSIPCTTLTSYACLYL